jgi:hypothetical protein
MNEVIPMKRLLLTAVAALVLVAPLAAQHRTVVLVRPGFGWGWYDPYWGPYPYGYYAGPATGEVKFDTKAKDAEVFVDGAYAGTIRKLKTLNLRPGTYNIEVREPGQPTYAEKIYVIAGKTLHLKPDLDAQAQP